MASESEAACRRLDELAIKPGPVPEFGEAVADAVRRRIRFDGYGLIGTDPGSGLRAVMFSRNGVGGPRELARNEFTGTDVNRYASLARRQLPVGILEPTEERCRQSARLGGILRPAGFESELRLILRAYGQVWGALTLYRSGKQRSFNQGDAAAAEELRLTLAQAIRAFSVRRFHASFPRLDAGTIVLASDDRLLTRTAVVASWLRELVAGGEDEMSVEDILRVVFDASHAARTSGRSHAVCIRAMSGRWVRLTAAPADDGTGNILITLASAAPLDVLPSFAQWHALTPRECHVTERVLAGDLTKHIARSLDISHYTVGDHLKSIYRKTRCSGREELIAALVT